MILWGDIFQLQIKRLMKEQQEFERKNKEEKDIKEMFIRIRELWQGISDGNQFKDDAYQLYLKYEKRYYKVK